VNTAIVDRVVDGQLNRLEQPPQEYQGWTATRVWRILRRRGEIRRHDAGHGGGYWTSTARLARRRRAAELLG